MKWSPKRRPDLQICPERFCFHWVQAGGRAPRSGELYRTLDDALEAVANSPRRAAGECNCAFGLCTRRDPRGGDDDWYEPAEPELKKARLPWFYFVNRAKLTAEAQRQYDRDSAQWWEQSG